MTTSRRDFLRIGGLAAMAGSAGILHPAEQMPVGEEIKRLRFPGPLRSGDVIGITSPSAGVKPALRPRMQFAYQTLIRLGYGYREGQCLWGKSLLSAPAPQRAEELMQMLLDDSIGAVFPPNGGELLIDMLPFIDFDVLARAQPKWILGYSDMSTFMLPYTLKTGIATLSGTNLWECPSDPRIRIWPIGMTWFDFRPDQASNKAQPLASRIMTAIGPNCRPTSPISGAGPRFAGSACTRRTTLAMP